MIYIQLDYIQTIVAHNMVQTTLHVVTYLVLDISCLDFKVIKDNHT